MRNLVNDKIFDFCYEMALRDATLRIAYLGSIDELRSCNDMRDAVRNYIDSLPTEDSEIYCVIDKVMEFAPRSKDKDGKDVCFTYGNAQKLVNMTAKYMYIATFYDESLKDRFNNCHCPMDSYIVDEVIKDLNNPEMKTKALSEYRSITDNTNKAWISYLRRPWSKADDKQYRLFQNLVQLVKETNANAVDYDYTRWKVRV